jgi:hypothetical protein
VPLRVSCSLGTKRKRPNEQINKMREQYALALCCVLRLAFLESVGIRSAGLCLGLYGDSLLGLLRLRNSRKEPATTAWVFSLTQPITGTRLDVMLPGETMACKWSRKMFRRRRGSAPRYRAPE